MGDPDTGEEAEVHRAALDAYLEQTATRQAEKDLQRQQLPVPADAAINFSPAVGKLTHSWHVLPCRTCWRVFNVCIRKQGVFLQRWYDSLQLYNATCCKRATACYQGVWHEGLRCISPPILTAILQLQACSHFAWKCSRRKG